MVLAGLGDAWIRFLGARDSARLAPRHSQQTPLPATTLRAPGRVVAALLFRSACRGIWTPALGLTYRLHSIRNHRGTRMSAIANRNAREDHRNVATDVAIRSDRR